MVNKEDFLNYLGVNTAPANFDRLLYLSVQELRSIMVQNVPNKSELTYKEFQKAILEQINYFDINSDLVDSITGSGASLGSYHEGSNSNQNTNSKGTNRISPMAYKILLNAGLLYPGLGGF